MFDNRGGILFGQRSRGAPGRRWAWVAVAALATAGCGEPETPAAAEPDVDLVSAAAHDPVFEAVEVTERIYATVVREGISPSRYAASLIVVRSDHVLVVDTREDPVAARRLIETIRAITDLPVRYVVNTHWHGDHVRGNAAFRTAFPNVRIIGTRVTSEEITERGRGRLDEEIARATEALRAAADRLQAGTRPDGSPMSEEERTGLADRIAAAEERLEALGTVEPTPPDIVVERVAELADAAPLVEIVPIGKAHTAGDLIVSIPALRVLAVGDLLEDGFPWFGDGYPARWAEALDRIAAREPEFILPAHGPVLRDREMLDTQRAFVNELARAARSGRDAGMSESEALAAADFTAFEAHFTRRLGELAPIDRRARFEAFVSAAFSRAWAEARGELP